jgi:GT2 family glycosyltransferase
METLTASIVIYNNDANAVRKAVRSFVECPIAGHLFIIDNSPSVHHWEFLKHPKIKYHFAGANLGYGRAHNVAIRQCLETSAYHLVLNPDVYFEPRVLEKLFYFMEEHPQSGLVMPRVLYPDGRLQHLCKLLPSPLNLATRRFIPFKNTLLRKINERYEMRSSHYSKVMNVPFLSGCFMFLRTAALKKTGLFDERFFLYAEDTDLSRRLHRHHKTMFFPFVEIYHTHARGSYKNLKLTWHNLKSAVQYFNKWGWFFDAERKETNETAQQQFSSFINYGPTILRVLPCHNNP